jgi:hypothetical protein
VGYGCVCKVLGHDPTGWGLCQRAAYRRIGVVTQECFQYCTMAKKVSQWMTLRERRNCDTRYADPFPLSAMSRDGVLPTVSVFIMTVMMLVVTMVVIM